MKKMLRKIMLNIELEKLYDEAINIFNRGKWDHELVNKIEKRENELKSLR